MTSLLGNPVYGISPSENTSHSNTPKLQTSVFDVKIPSKKASGGIHLIGSIALPPLR